MRTVFCDCQAAQLSTTPFWQGCQRPGVTSRPVTRPYKCPVCETSFGTPTYTKSMTGIDDVVILKDWKRAHPRQSCLAGTSVLWGEASLPSLVRRRAAEHALSVVSQPGRMQVD